jgi:MFS family permease
MTKDLRKVITASSVGTLIEWYDFYIFGAMSTIIANQFFPKENQAAAFLATLATFAAGFIVRPFGALVFGRLGDLVGRKYTFLVTLLLMGGSTFAIGLIPGYAQWGVAAPILVLILRLLQGLALGGEYGGAATYVAEHAPEGKRGYYTAYIQTTATLGFFLSLGVILAVRQWTGAEAFGEWGWRVPFLVSIFLVGVSIFIRLRMEESPLFAKVKAEGKVSKNPLKESFARKENLKWVLLALFGVVMGQGVVWYAGQFYAQTFIEKSVGVEFEQTRYLLCIAILAATPFFLVFGAWSDRIGRPAIMLAGMLLAIVTYRPIYKAMYQLGQPEGALIHQTMVKKPAGTNGDSLMITTNWYQRAHGSIVMVSEKQGISTSKKIEKPEVSKTVWLSSSAFWWMVLFVFVQILYVTMVYGPIAAYLVELFPTHIRYTSMSLPYHIGNGIFGGLTPYITVRLVNESSKFTTTGATDPYFGLWYPIGVGAVSLLIGCLFLFKVPVMVRRISGLLWIAIAIAALGFMIWRADVEIGKAIMEGKPDEILNQRMFWWIILPIFTPIMAGLALFGWYAWKGEYDEIG